MLASPSSVKMDEHSQVQSSSSGFRELLGHSVNLVARSKLDPEIWQLGRDFDGKLGA